MAALPADVPPANDEAWPFVCFLACLPRQIDRAQRALESLTLLAIELDRGEERLGALDPAAAEQVMRGFEIAVATCIRGADQAFGANDGRQAVMLPRTSKGDATRVAERIRRKCREALAHAPCAGEEGWTVSVGMSCFPGDARDDRTLWRLAQAGVTQAQREGGDRIILHDDDRRSSRRVTLDLACRLETSAGDREARIVNGSELNLCLETDTPHPVGTVLRVHYRPEPEIELRGTLRVDRTETLEASRYRCAGPIIDMAAPDLHRFVGWIETLREREADPEAPSSPGSDPGNERSPT